MTKIYKRRKWKFWKRFVVRHTNKLLVSAFCEYVERQNLERLQNHQEMMSKLKEVDESVWLVAGQLKRMEDVRD